MNPSLIASPPNLLPSCHGFVAMQFSYHLQNLRKSSCCFTALDLRFPISLPTSSGSPSLPVLSNEICTERAFLWNSCHWKMNSVTITYAHIPRSSIFSNSTEIYIQTPTPQYFQLSSSLYAPLWNMSLCLPIWCLNCQIKPKWSHLCFRWSQVRFCVPHQLQCKCCSARAAAGQRSNFLISSTFTLWYLKNWQCLARTPCR